MTKYNVGDYVLVRNFDMIGMGKILKIPEQNSRLFRVGRQTSGMPPYVFFEHEFIGKANNLLVWAYL